MTSERFLLSLFKQPFGPYLEETILSEKCKFMPSRRLLLEDFQLANNNKPTGYVSPDHPIRQCSHMNAALIAQNLMGI